MLKSKMTYLGMLSVLVALIFLSCSNPYKYSIEKEDGYTVHYPFGETGNEVKIRTWHSYYIENIDGKRILVTYNPKYISTGEIFMVPEGRHKFLVNCYRWSKANSYKYLRRPIEVEYNLRRGHDYLMCFRYSGDYYGEPLFHYNEEFGIYQMSELLKNSDDLSDRLWNENVIIEPRILDITGRKSIGKPPFGSLAPDCYP